MHSDERLWKHLDGELSPDESRAIEEEARSDAALAARLAEFRLMKREVLAGAPKPPPGFADSVVAAATRAAPVVHQLQRMLRRTRLAAAVLAAACLALAVFVLSPEDLQAAPGTWADEDRVKEFREYLDLDEKQVLLLREILGRHDAEIEKKRKRILMERQREFNAIHDRYNSKIREMLTPEQLRRYDRRGKAD